MKKTIIAVLALLVVGFVAYFLVSKNNSSQNVVNNPNTYTPPVSNSPETNPFMSGGTSANLETTNPNPPLSNIAPTPTPSSVSVDIRNFAFSPSTLEVKVGTKVTWTNNDTAPHTVTSDAGSLLQSPTLSSGQ